MKLDIFANGKMKAALKARGQVAGIASEEEAEIIVFEGVENGKVDGSTGWFVQYRRQRLRRHHFSIYWRITPVSTPMTEEDFLQLGNKQVADGYVVYGSSTMLVCTTGGGVHAFPATEQMYSLTKATISSSSMG